MQAVLQRAKIVGTGMFVPEEITTNKDLEKRMDTSDEWIQQRSGIQERRYAKPGIGPADLAYEASLKALEMASVKPEDLDLIVFATLSPDYYFPGSAVFLQNKLQCRTIASYDVRNQCTGFLYAINLAQMAIATGQSKRALVIGAETHSRALNFTTEGRDVAVLFGDGAGAVVLAPSDSPKRGIFSAHLHADGAYRDKLKLEFPSSRQWPLITKENIDAGGHFPYMDGRLVFKHAVTHMPEVVMEALQYNGITTEDVSLYLFHQANLRINEAVLKQLHQPESKTYNNIQRYGNCSAASIPMCLDECVRSDRLKPEDWVIMTGFGAGFTWGSVAMRW